MSDSPKPDEAKPEPTDATKLLSQPAASKSEGTDSAKKPQVRSEPVPLSRLLGVSIPVAVVLVVLAYMISPLLAVVVLCAVVLAGIVSFIARWAQTRHRPARRPAPSAGRPSAAGPGGANRPSSGRPAAPRGAGQPQAGGRPQANRPNSAGRPSPTSRPTGNGRPSAAQRPNGNKPVKPSTPRPAAQTPAGGRPTAPGGRRDSKSEPRRPRGGAPDTRGPSRPAPQGGKPTPPRQTRTAGPGTKTPRPFAGRTPDRQRQDTKPTAPREQRDRKVYWAGETRCDKRRRPRSNDRDRPKRQPYWRRHSDDQGHATQLDRDTQRRLDTRDRQVNRNDRPTRRDKPVRDKIEKPARTKTPRPARTRSTTTSRPVAGRTPKTDRPKPPRKRKLPPMPAAVPHQPAAAPMSLDPHPVDTPEMHALAAAVRTAGQPQKEIPTVYAQMIDTSSPESKATTLANAATTARADASRLTEQADEMLRQAAAMDDKPGMAAAAQDLRAEVQKLHDDAAGRIGWARAFEEAALDMAAERAGVGV